MHVPGSRLTHVHVGTFLQKTCSSFRQLFSGILGLPCRQVLYPLSSGSSWHECQGLPYSAQAHQCNLHWSRITTHFWILPCTLFRWAIWNCQHAVDCDLHKWQFHTVPPCHYWTVLDLILFTFLYVFPIYSSSGAVTLYTEKCLQSS